MTAAMSAAMTLVVSLLVVVLPLSAPAHADAGLSPAFVKTLGGPQHSQIYPGGVETSAVDNTIVVADTGNNQIAKYSQNGTELWRIGQWGSGVGQFDNPRDVGVDSLGNIFVIDTRNSRIVKLSKDGAWISTYNGNNTSLLINFPVGGSVSNNILYVADTGRKRVLAVRTTDWSVVREVVKNPGTQTTGLNTCNSFLDIRDADGDSAGNIYVAGYSYNQIAKVTSAGICTYWGSTGTGNGQFKTPYGVRVARDPITGVDELYVADALNFRVQEFTLNGQFVAKMGVEGTPGQQGTITTMRRVAVATDGSGDVWAADLWGFQLERYDRTVSGYTWAQSIGTPLGAATDTSVFHEPRQIGIGPDGILNIIDTVHHRFVRMDTDGHIQRICGERASEGSTLGKFNWPRGLKVDEATGQIWVADTKQNRVQIINPDCSGVTYVGSGQGSGLSQLNWPYAIDIRQSDRIAFIADTENNRVVAYNVATRQPIGTYGSTGSGWNQMLKPQSIAVDPATGNLLIADTENNRIKVVSTTNGITYTTLQNVNRGFNHPEGISTDAQGRIYVADSGNNQVVILNSLFEVTGIFTGNGFNHPAGVTVSGQDLYVSDTYNDTVDVFTWDVPVPDKPAPYVRTLAGPSVAAMYASGFEYDATSNQLVIADTGLDRILRYTLGGAKVSEFGSPGSADGQFESPRDVAVDGAGNIYVADAENNRIQKFSASGVWQWTRGGTGSCNDCLFTPIGITWDAVNQVVLVASSAQDQIKAWDANGVFKWNSGNIGVNGPRDAARGPDGRIWVSDYANHRIKAFNVTAAGVWTTTPVYSLGGPGDGDLNFPYNMVWDAAGTRMYVADTGTGRIVIYDKSGSNWTFTTAWGGRCTPHPAPCADPGSPNFQPGKFNHLRRVAIDGAGKVYGMDFWGNGAEVFNANGTYASSIEGATAPVPGFAQPYGVSVAPNGNVYVMERLNQRIQALDPSGNYLASGGDRGTGLGSFSWPEAVAVGPDGRVWAADTRGNNVQRWSESLASADLLLDGTQVGGFDRITGLSFGPDGRLWIVDSWKNRVVPYNPSTGTYGTPIGIGGIGDGQLNHPEGVAVSATNVYIADTLNNRVQKFTLTGQFVAQVSAGLITPEGLTIAPDGTVWVADTGNGRIRHFDANLVDLTDGFGHLGTGPGEFDRPHSLAAHNGFLYVADTYNHRVQKFRIGENAVGLNVTADGSISNPGGVAPMYPGGGVSDGTNWYIADSGNSRVLKIDAARNVTVVSSTGWNDPRSIALDPDGTHLWVGDQSGPGGTNKVVEITKTGTVVKSIGGTGLYGPWGLFVDTTGVYIADTYDNRVVKINPNTDTEIWSTTTFGGTALSRPRTLTMGSDGFIYAGDTDNDRIVKINATTGAAVSSFAADRPRGLASDGAGGLWVGDAKNYRLVHMTTTGTVLGATTGGYGTGPGQFRQQSGIFMSGTSVVVGDQFSYQLQRFTVNGSGAPVYAETVGGTPPAPGGFNGPFGLSYGPNGELYVADWFNHRIEKFNANRSFAAQWGGYGTGGGSLIFPRGVLVAPNGQVVVTDSENNRLSFFDGNGGFVKTLIPLVFGLNRPGQTAIAANGTYWIADTDNNRLVHIDSAAIVLKTVTDGVSAPRGIAIDANGDIFVANDGTDTITKYDSSGTLIGQIVGSGAGQGQVKDPHNITIGVVGDSELLFVADAGNDRVQAFGTSGASVAAFGIGALDAPKGVALSPDGTELAVSDHLHNRVAFYSLGVVPPQPPDTTPPVGAVSVPVQNGTYTVASIGTISGTATDDQSGVGSVLVGIKNRTTNEWLQANGTWSSTVYRAPATLDVPGGTSVNWTRTWTPIAGSFAVNVITTDAVGNEDPNRPNVLFTVTAGAPDTQPPDGTVTVPTSNQTFQLGTIIMSGNATDNVGVGQVLVAVKNKTTGQWWNGSAWQAAFVWAGNASLGSPGATSSAWSYSWAAPAAGSYLLQVRADDTSGNMDPTKPSVSFSVSATAPDTQAPNPNVTVPSANQNFPLGNVITSGSATDNVGVTQVRVAIKNKSTNQWWTGSGWQSAFVWGGNATLGSPGAPSTSWSYTFAAPANGSYAIEARADDAAGNFTATALVSFTVTSSAPDTQAPNPTTNVPSNNQTFSPGLIIMGGNATDNVGVTRVRVAVKNKTTNRWWNGTAWQSTFAWAGDATMGSPGSTSTSWTFSYTASSAASYAMQVRADDAAGNFTTNPFVNFTVA